MKPKKEKIKPAKEKKTQVESVPDLLETQVIGRSVIEPHKDIPNPFDKSIRELTKCEFVDFNNTDNQ